MGTWLSFSKTRRGSTLWRLSFDSRSLRLLQEPEPESNLTPAVAIPEELMAETKRTPPVARTQNLFGKPATLKLKL